MQRLAAAVAAVPLLTEFMCLAGPFLGCSVGFQNLGQKESWELWGSDTWLQMAITVCRRPIDRALMAPT